MSESATNDRAVGAVLASAVGDALGAPYGQERLGHSTIAITLGIYSHVAPTLHDEAAQLIAELVLDG